MDEENAVFFTLDDLCDEAGIGIGKREELTQSTSYVDDFFRREFHALISENFRSGIEIKAEMGEPVRCIGNGRVLYANWFRSYGNVMIVYHGNHYFSVYGRLEEFFKAKGDAVEAGEVIATVGDSGSLSGPQLYFEIRHHGKPLDPLKWLKKG